ncbi:DoxX family protein [Arsenicicoccus sp. oral taxon 190]|uniref:DoxX family protein n=1 Tax=Arsenicicoccus sp. oral taxon 190 TaxID=1658671 RepID=UPI00067A11F1|nr:MauE/DoxX family redox-associated membrane protein [Arsenicicoccus sp. oral taxon 190]AKT50847.1 membrane protein [Arsenicicoccus sp. oral taxon 190]
MTNPPAARRTALGLATLLTVAGIQHFRRPEPFDSIVPPQVPGSARFWTLASGAAELVTAVLLVVPRTRRAGGAAATALFVAVFPANVQMAWLWRRRPLRWQAVSIGRLPLQGLLVKWSEDVRRHG